MSVGFHCFLSMRKAEWKDEVIMVSQPDGKLYSSSILIMISVYM